MRNVPAMGGGIPSAEVGVPASKSGVPAAKGGVPAAKSGVPATEGWVPAAKSGVPSAKDRVPVEGLMTVRSQLIESVNEMVLNKLLDKLLEQSVIKDEEMESVRSKNRADKVRHVIDMVRKKGTAAISVLIAALCEEDPYLSRKLNLM